MRFSFRLISAILGCALTAASQSSPGRASFEAASVRPSTSGFNGMRGGCRGIDSSRGPNNTTIPLGRCVITDARLSQLIMAAWHMNSYQIRNAPNWVIKDEERYNVQAEAAEPNATEAQLLGMLQKLLEDAFQLKYHRADGEQSGYALVIAKNGPKLEKCRDQEVPSLVSSDFTISARRHSMAMFASYLSTLGAFAVKDETGLRDFYDLNLSWNEAEGISMGTALEEQAGLSLEPRKVRVSYFVIDSAERPGTD